MQSAAPLWSAVAALVSVGWAPSGCRVHMLVAQMSSQKAGSAKRVRGEGRGLQRSGSCGPYPVVDLFAGPGGLGEGFASVTDGRGGRRFHSIASIERDEFSHQTLLLRHFFRQFPEGEAPEAYYDFLARRITLEELFHRHDRAFQAAKLSALRISLGPESHAEVYEAIRGRLRGNNNWALVGGPPCQAYSLVGRSRMMGRPDFERDERHTLYREYLRIIVDHAPPIFVMENVKGLLSATISGRSAISRILRDLEEPGRAMRSGSSDLSYRLYSLSEEGVVARGDDPRKFVVRAEQHGIPQARHRMFIVGIRSDLNVQPGTLRKLKAPTVQDTIGSLPRIRSTLSRGVDSHTAWLSEIQKLGEANIRHQLNGATYSLEMSRALDSRNLLSLRTPKLSSSTQYPRRPSDHEILERLHDSRLAALTGHEARGHMASDLRRYFYAATFADRTGTSPQLADFPPDLLPEHKNVELGRSGKMFSDRFRVQLAGQVSTTVTSHICKDGHYFIHYDPAQCRSLTVREAARLQTFPDNYYFLGPRTAQYHQVGNAVPPQLAHQIAEIVAEVLDRIRGRP